MVYTDYVNVLVSIRVSSVLTGARKWSLQKSTLQQLMEENKNLKAALSALNNN